MLPTYRSGQPVLALRAALRRRPVRQGDVVLLRRGRDILVKRVVYVGGALIPSDEARSYSAVTDYFDVAPGIRVGSTADARLRVPLGHCVVLGDNRAASEDSRQFGPIPYVDIVGHVVWAPIWP